MPRLRRVSPRSRGWTRRRVGRGFTYLDHDGLRLDVADVERIKALAIPPAWQDVWICPFANGHIQATGRDAAGRLQYLYHPAWRAKQDELKFSRLQVIGPRMARARQRMIADLAQDGMPASRAAATAGRLLDLGYFRIGSDTYADANGSFGLTTLERRHVRRDGTHLRFSFVGKSGIEHSVQISDSAVIEALNVMRRRRGAERLLAYRSGRSWRNLDAATVNEYLSELLDEDLTAKDFRTWHATVTAAVALAGSAEPVETAAARRRAVKTAVEQVATYLGNTPTIARGSYIDPRVIERFEAGETIAAALRREHRDPLKQQARIEKAVAKLLAD